ncbi:unnamed protein product [Eruca vesicaria subsp. sativa]|uniref:Protein kinase domain-containing protein n=1 Tax=Eruca vesicaria subsp. sativa TaxID=29727 RepID=A0ABC8LH45_ERUVS|nr:unnamed protein product [Eruca vesicaria subsp. sativa]
MSREFIVLVLFFTLSSSTYNSNGKLILEGAASFDLSGFTKLTNTTKHSYGHVFNTNPVLFKNLSFHIHVHFAIIPEHNNSGSHGMTCVLSPTRHLPGVSSDQYLGLFNKTTNGNKTSNNIIAIELDINKDDEFGDINDNHVGININSLRSIVSRPAGYYDDNDGKFYNLSLISGKVMRLSIVYSHPDKQLDVTLSPAEFSDTPWKPLLSLKRDLSPYILEEMYLGFTASTGSVGAIHYMLNSVSGPGVDYPSFDISVVPTLPPYPKKVTDKTRMILAVCLVLAVIVAFVTSLIGFLFYMRHKKVKEVLEEWEVQYGPHRFAYKELYNATKGFKEKQVLGSGGFGQVYRGTLPGSDAEIAVKRTCHGSSQGKSEFIAEISTIELWEEGKLFDASEESIRQEPNRGEIELVLKLGVLCSHQAESVRPDMSAVMRILNGVLQLPDNLLDVVRAERLRGQPEISMEMLLGMNSISTLPFTNSFISHGR